MRRLQAARQFLPEYATPATSSAKDASLDGMLIVTYLSNVCEQHLGQACLQSAHVDLCQNKS